jgi:hypothetical protein
MQPVPNAYMVARVWSATASHPRHMTTDGCTFDSYSSAQRALRNTQVRAILYESDVYYKSLGSDDVHSREYVPNTLPVPTVDTVHTWIDHHPVTQHIHLVQLQPVMDAHPMGNHA